MTDRCFFPDPGAPIKMKILRQIFSAVPPSIEASERSGSVLVSSSSLLSSLLL